MGEHEAHDKIDAMARNPEGADAPQQTGVERKDGGSSKGGVALCFSGGGIRSATFNLGVLQELARNEWLKRVDCLSTVSGGGYIGSWFVAQIARARDQNILQSAKEAKEEGKPILRMGSPDDLIESRRVASENAAKAVIEALARCEQGGARDGEAKLGVSTADTENSLPPNSSIKRPNEPKDASLKSVEEAVGWLRSYSNYLSPTWGLSKDALTLVAIYFRNLAIHWMILLPVLIAVLLVPRIVHLIVLDPNYYLTQLFWLTIISVVLMGAFSTNGPPAQGERRSGGVNLMWHLVCFIVPLLVIPICLTAMAGANGDFEVVRHILVRLDLELINTALIDLGLGSWSTVVHFTLAGAALYLLGSVVVLLFRAPIALVPDVQSREDRTWVVRLNRLLRVEAGISASRNFSTWIRRFPFRALLNVLTGSFAGGLCGLSFTIARAAPIGGELTTALTPVLFVFSIWFASVLRVAIATRFSNEPSREWWARATGGSLIGIVFWVVVALLVLWLPLAILELSVLRTGWAAGAAGLGGLLLAAGTTAIGYWSKRGAELSKQVSRWHDRLGKGVIEIAALLTLVGVTLILNLVIAYGVRQLAGSASTDSSERMVYACASSVTGEVGGTPVSAQIGVACPLGALLLQDMPTRGFTKEDIDGARNRFTACCVEDSNGNLLASKEGLCPPAQDARQDEDTKATKPSRPMVDMLCVPPSKSNNEEGRANSSQRESGEAQNMQVPIDLSASLPIPLQIVQGYRYGLKQADAKNLVFVMLGLALLSLLMSWLAGADTYSLQAMYANRLTRAYLGASNRDGSKGDVFTEFNSGDDLPLHELRGIRPELVINAALNLTKVEQKTLAWQQRKASTFTMRPEWCGSGQDRSADTACYELDSQAITLGQAISISGAAVSPNMGYHSSPAMAAVLTLFNLRLGRWMPNPDFPLSKHRLGSLGALFAIVDEMRSKVGGGGKFVYVTDGGHFENLGVYAMLQRQCDLVVAVDAGADPDFEFEDLENLIRKARVDLGVEIQITDVHSCAALIKQFRYLHGSIEYPDGGRGELIILKPVMCGDEPYDVIRYAETVRKAGSIFPQQPTPDQFFDEAQFESYRILGRHTVRKVFGEKGTPPGPPVIAAKGCNVPDKTTGGDKPPDPLPPDKPGLIGSAADATKSFGSMGQAALLASAITLTGVVGVSGVVSLKESTLSLDAESMRQLQDLGGRVSLSERTIEFDQKSLKAHEEVAKSGMVRVDVSGLRQDLNDEFKNFDWSQIVESQSFKSVVDAFTASLASTELTVNVVNRGSPSNTEDLNKSLAELKDSVTRLEESSRRFSDAAKLTESSSTGLRQSTRDLQDAVVNFKLAVEEGSPAKIVDSLNRINGTLNRVGNTLGEIKGTVEEISPRNTIRGAP